MFLISALLPLLTKFLHSKQNDYSLNMHLINCPFQELADVYCFVYGLNAGLLSVRLDFA